MKCRMLQQTHEESDNHLSVDDKIIKAESLHMKNKKYEFAVNIYNSSLQFREDMEFRHQIYLNLCNAFYKLKDFGKVELYARKAPNECIN
jgi:hypothetical protein